MARVTTKMLDQSMRRIFLGISMEKVHENVIKIKKFSFWGMQWFLYGFKLLVNNYYKHDDKSNLIKIKYILLPISPRANKGQMYQVKSVCKLQGGNFIRNLKKKIKLEEVGSNFKKKYQLLNLLPDDRYICTMFWAEKTKKLHIGHQTIFFASRPSLCGGGYMRYKLWISTNDALAGLLQISCIISKDNANRNTMK
jgi:hypothetical protein